MESVRQWAGLMVSYGFKTCIGGIPAESTGFEAVKLPSKRAFGVAPTAFQRSGCGETCLPFGPDPWRSGDGRGSWAEGDDLAIGPDQAAAEVIGESDVAAELPFLSRQFDVDATAVRMRHAAAGTLQRPQLRTDLHSGEAESDGADTEDAGVGVVERMRGPGVAVGAGAAGERVVFVVEPELEPGRNLRMGNALARAL